MVNYIGFDADIVIKKTIGNLADAQKTREKFNRLILGKIMPKILAYFYEFVDVVNIDAHR